MSSPTQRTLELCRKRGWLACVVERWLPHVNRRIDVYGFGDILALDSQPGALLIQATSLANVAGRVAKIRTDCAHEARRWLAAGNRIAVWGWGKRAGDRSWSVRVVEIRGSELAAYEPPRVFKRRLRKSRQLGLTL